MSHRNSPMIEVVAMTQIHYYIYHRTGFHNIFVMATHKFSVFFFFSGIMIIFKFVFFL